MDDHPYKSTENCFLRKKQFDDSMCPITKKADENSIDQMYEFINQFHNSEIIFNDLPQRFSEIIKFIDNFSEKDHLYRSISNSPLCQDLIRFFQENAPNLPDSYLDLVYKIANLSMLFNENPNDLIFIFFLIDKIDLFPDNQKSLIIAIIIFILRPCENNQFLKDFFSSNQHQKLLHFALTDPVESDNISNLKSGSQIIISILYKNLINSQDDLTFSGNLLENFFKTLDANNFINVQNEQFIMQVSVEVISKHPPTHAIVYKHPTYFAHLFSHLKPDCKFCFTSFKLISHVIESLPPGEFPDMIEDFLNWDDLFIFFDNVSVSLFRMMISFCASYLRFGSSIFHLFAVRRNLSFHLKEIFKVDQLSFFEVLIATIRNNDLPFMTLVAATNLLINATLFSAKTQVLELFRMNVIPIFLNVLENDFNEPLTKDILNSIHTIWEVCVEFSPGPDDQVPLVNQFVESFHDECGYEILLNLTTCAQQAQSLHDCIGDNSTC